MQDKVRLPESLEEAFEHLKSDPSDFELARERAAAWEVVQQKGRRGLWWSKVKLLTAGLGAVAVAAMAILIPVRLEGWQTAGEPQTPVKAIWDDSQEYYTKREAYYRSLGFSVAHLNPELGLDLIYNEEAAFAVRDGERSKLFDISKEYDVIYMGGHSGYVALVTRSKQILPPDDTDNLYLVRLDTMQAQQIDTIGEVTQAKDWNVLPAKLLFTQLDTVTGKQQIASVEWKSGKIEVLHEANERYFNQVENHDEDVVISNGYEIKRMDQSGEWSTVARSDQGRLNIYSLDDEVIHYTDENTLSKYNIRQGQATLVLEAGGEPNIVRMSSSTSAYLISVFVENEPHEPLTSSRTRFGTLELWQVDMDGEQPKKIWEKRDVPHYEQRLYEVSTPGVSPEQRSKWIQLKADPNVTWDVWVNVETGDVKEEENEMQN